jgi:hypothetical protein
MTIAHRAPSQLAGRLLLPALLVLPAAAYQESTSPDLWFLNGPERVDLDVDASTLGVRFEAFMAEAEARRLIEQFPSIEQGQAQAARFVPGHTMLLQTREGTDAQAALGAAETIRAVPGVMSASPRLVGLEDPYFLTEEVLVRWLEGTEAAARQALTAELVATAQLEYATNPGVAYRVPHGADPLAIANGLASSGLVEFAIPDFQLRRVPNAGTNDPLYGDQWHLENTGQNGAKVDADIDVEGAWDVTRGDASLIVAVVDTGMELQHPDLKVNLVQGIDVLDNDNDPSAEDFWFGLFQEKHATAVGGVAAGKGNNNLGTTGVAQRCKIMPIRFLSENPFIGPTVQDEADAFNFARQNGAAVINNSWGPLGAATLPASTKAAIDSCNQNGRGGLGMLVMFAAGNSNSNNSNNGYTSYSGTVSVTATDDTDKRASYSSFGGSTDFCAPSNGGTNGITTTDRIGNKGYSTGDYTDAFGGTSSACPCAAGVALLVMSADLSLTRQAVLDILYETAEKVDPGGGNYGSDGHSNFYGFGRLNAADAVAMADSGSCAAQTYCVLSPNSVGPGATITSTGSLSVADNQFTLLSFSAPSGEFGLFFYGASQTQVGLGDGTLCVGGNLHRLPVVQVDMFGLAEHTVDFTAAPPNAQITPGSTWNFQFWFRDPPGGPAGYNLSNGLSVLFCP